MNSQVGHDDLETGVLWSEDVSLWYLHIIEFDVCCSGSSGVRSLDQLGVDIVISLDEQHSVALVRLASSDKVVAENAVGNPLSGQSVLTTLRQKFRRCTHLLRAIDDIVLSILAQLTCRPQTCHVTSSECLSDSKTDFLLSGQYLL